MEKDIEERKSTQETESETTEATEVKKSKVRDKQAKTPKDIEDTKAHEEQATPPEDAEEKKKWSVKGKVTACIIVLIAVAGIAFGTFVVLSGQRTVSTGNARVTTNLIYITADMPGYLERLNVGLGAEVYAGQLLGWLHGGESFRSPVDGVIVNVNAVVDEHIRPMEPFITIADLGNLHIQANLYESDIQDIRLGQPVSVTLDGVRGRSFAGYVSHIGLITELELVGGAIMVQTGAFRRITHTVPVQITIINDVDLYQFLGTNARVSIPVIG